MSSAFVLITADGQDTQNLSVTIRRAGCRPSDRIRAPPGRHARTGAG